MPHFTLIESRAPRLPRAGFQSPDAIEYRRVASRKCAADVQLRLAHRQDRHYRHAALERTPDRLPLLPVISGYGTQRLAVNLRERSANQRAEPVRHDRIDGVVRS